MIEFGVGVVIKTFCIVLYIHCNHAIKRQILTTANVFLMWNNISVAFITSKNERSTGILDHNLKYPVTKSKGLGIPLITIQEF